MGGGEEGARGEEISQMDMMKCLDGHMECLGGMRLQSFLTLFTRATPGTPARRGQWKGGDGEGATGKGRQRKGQMGGGEEGARGEEISQMDMMKCLDGHMECLGGMRLQSFLTLFTRATPGTPARRGQWKGGDGEGATGKVRQGKGQMGGGEEGARGEEISQMDMMKCLDGHMECLGGMRLQSFLTLFTRATPGTPASII